MNRAAGQIPGFFSSPRRQCRFTVAGDGHCGKIRSSRAGLAATVAAAAVKGVVVSASALTILKGTIELMTATKIGLTVGACAAAAIIGLEAREISIQKQSVKQLEAMADEINWRKATRARPWPAGRSRRNWKN